MSLILCGLPASGKTTVGKRLSEKLGHHFIDLDHLIEHAYYDETGKMMSCRQIAMQEGSHVFRHLEKQQIHQLNVITGCVIALGGGTLCDPSNTEKIKRLGRLIYLKTPEHVIWKRIEQRELPSFLDKNAPEQSFYELAKERIPIYENAAEMMIDTETLNEEAIVEMIIKRINNGR